MSDFRGRARSVRIAMAQLDCAPGDVGANLSRARQIVAEARAAGADLVVFPELFLTGYLASPGCGDLVVPAPLNTEELVMAEMDLAGVARRREMLLLENPRLDLLLQELGRLTTNREEAGVQRSPPRAWAPEHR